MNKRVLKFTGTIAAVVLPIYLFLGDVSFSVWWERVKWWQLLIITAGVLLVAFFIYSIFACEFQDQKRYKK